MSDSSASRAWSIDEQRHVSGTRHAGSLSATSRNASISSMPRDAGMRMGVPTPAAASTSSYPPWPAGRGEPTAEHPVPPAPPAATKGAEPVLRAGGELRQAEMACRGRRWRWRR